MALYWHLQPRFRFQLVKCKLLLIICVQNLLFCDTVWKKDWNLKKANISWVKKCKNYSKPDVKLSRGARIPGLTLLSLDVNVTAECKNMQISVLYSYHSVCHAKHFVLTCIKVSWLDYFWVLTNNFVPPTEWVNRIDSGTEITNPYIKLRYT